MLACLAQCVASFCTELSTVIVDELRKSPTGEGLAGLQPEWLGPLLAVFPFSGLRIMQYFDECACSIGEGTLRMQNIAQLAAKLHVGNMEALYICVQHREW